MTALHTPTPWAVRNSAFEDEMLILCDETCVASVPIWDDDDDTTTLSDQSYANAAFIVRACNTHETLLATLRLALRGLNAAPRFRVEETDSYTIAAAIEAALRDAGASPYLGAQS